MGVVPVTAVITEIRYGAREEARVHHRDGRAAEVALDQICGYISEKENPENTKQADLITVELPELRQFRGLKFVDRGALSSQLRLQCGYLRLQAIAFGFQRAVSRIGGADLRIQFAE